MTFGKRQIILSALVLALGTAVYLNWQFSSNPDLMSTNNIPRTKELGEAKYVNKSSDQQTSDEKKDNVKENDNEKKEENKPSSSSEYFSQAKLNRQKSRDEVTEMVKGILADTAASESAKQEAIKQAAALAKTIQQESNMENLIKAKGFSECLVFINGDECSVIVNAGSLKEESAINIKDIVAGQGGLSLEKLKIVEAK